MSRVSKNPIIIPNGVDVAIHPDEIIVKGPKGQLTQQLSSFLKVNMSENSIKIELNDDSKHANAMSGTMRTLIANMVKGVSEGFQKKLLLVGVGYKAQVNGNAINLNLGFSHSVNYPIPNGISVETPTPTEILINGIDKQKVGQVASEIRSYREPEPYKGKGVRYSDETVKLKEAKKK